ncbi:TPA: DUF234 domain-containing protein [Candidatus Bathyarchaeota archaeon]|nr:DUF234 domain-containing protein [Candidatus Bathyarchaeota archaeon]
MKTLQHEYRLVERTVPHGERAARSKKGQYEIKDNTLAFWFSHVYGKLTTPTDVELNSFIAKRFEGLCREVLTDYAHARGEKPVSRGRWWGAVKVDGIKHEPREIDIVVETDKTLYLGECKWTEKKVGKKELIDLRQTSQAFFEAKKPIKFVLFTKTGFDIEEDYDTLLFDASRIIQGSNDTLAT